MSHKQNEQNIVFISEMKHIDLLERFFEEYPVIREEGYLLIPTELEIEYALKDKGIPFHSGRLYRTRDASTMVLSEKWATSIFGSTQWSFFTYRGVSLLQLYFVPLQGYMAYTIYCAAIVTNVLSVHTHAKRLVTFSSFVGEPVKGSTLAGPQIRVFIDVIKCIATEKGIESIVVAAPIPPAAKIESVTFTLQRALFSVGVRILNSCIRLRRPRRIRALVSDYWKNIAPYAAYLDDSLEIILIDRKEALKAGLSNIWKFRMRFLHLDAFSSGVSSEYFVARNYIEREYQSLRKNMELPMCDFQGVSLRPLVSQALDLIVTEVLTETLKDIDDAHSMFERVKPHVVLLRATISNQTHFVILAQVARARNVPSLEVQHGLEYNGPGSFTRRHSAEYIGVYGLFTQREMKSTGDNRSTPIIIGSPRFDVYASSANWKSVKMPGKTISFLCIANAIETVADADAYAFEEYFSAIAIALKDISNARVIVKLRPGDNVRNVLARRIIASTLGDIPYIIAHNEPLSELFSNADVVISGYTTAAIEAMQCGKPLVYLGLSSIEKLFGLHHFPMYAENNAMRLATTTEDLAHILKELSMHPDVRAEIAAHAVAFLKREYVFDGHASERMADLILSLVGDKKQ